MIGVISAFFTHAALSMVKYICVVIIDGESCENVVSQAMVEKLTLVRTQIR